MIKPVLNYLNNYFKIYTALQVGFDSQFDVINSYFLKSDLITTLLPNLPEGDYIQHLYEKGYENRILSDFEYLNLRYDFVYISNNVDRDFQRRFLIKTYRDQTPFILCNPFLKTLNPTGYDVVKLKDHTNLLYTDIVRSRIDELR